MSESARVDTRYRAASAAKNSLFSEIVTDVGSAKLTSRLSVGGGKPVSSGGKSVSGRETARWSN